MGRVDCCAMDGYRLLFYSNDHHPAHVHVARPGEWEIRVDILETTEDELVFDVKWPGNYRGPSRPVRKALCALICAHREDLLEEFERKVQTQ